MRPIDHNPTNQLEDWRLPTMRRPSSADNSLSSSQLVRFPLDSRELPVLAWKARIEARAY